MANKKLIEVALPLEKINAESAREKSIRHGHPSTLHLWWARRPLAAARAVIWASLVDDPSSHPEQFPTEDDQKRERERLFKILEELVKWENSNDEAVLHAAKEEIRKSTGGNPPALLDPFAGGGAIPLEAQRLGLEAHAHDLNPVAVMINKAMIEIPPKFAGNPPVNPEARKRVDFTESDWRGASGLAEDVRYYGEWMKAEAFKRIGHLYPKATVPQAQGGGEATVIAWIWARTVKCPNPACGCEMPLANSFELSKKKGKEAYIKPEYNSETKKISYRVLYGKGSGDSPKVAKGKFRCIICGEVAPSDYIHTEFQAKRAGEQLMAVVAEGTKGRIYLSPDEVQRMAAIVEKPDIYPEQPMNTDCTDLVSSRGYGFTQWHELFTNRQLTALTTFSELVREAQTKAEADAVKAGMSNNLAPISEGGDGAKAYGEAVGVYLALLLDKLVDYHSSVCSWNPPRDGIRNTFARQAIPMVWDYAEANPFSNSSGCVDNMLEWVVKCVDLLPGGNAKGAAPCPAQDDWELPEHLKVMVSTDPPYYDNISYADLSDYFYIWMRQSLRNTYPDVFSTFLTPKDKELVATSYRFGGNAEKAKRFFEEGMLKACKQVYQYAREDFPVTIYYAYKQSETTDDKTSSTGWETMLSSIIEAGFSITGTWPMRTERPGRMIEVGANALASSIVLVCRKRPADAPQVERKKFENALRRELYPALQKLQESNIAPVDLAQSAIGPGMAVFSRYRRVLEANGAPLGVRDALRMINKQLDLYFNEQSDELDAASRFCVDFYTQNAYNAMKYGDAEVLANARSAPIPNMVSGGFLYAKGGFVRLLERDELPETVSPNEKTVWLVAQGLTRAMETGGIEACARIVAALYGSSAERAKELAYRLYTVAERKKWADEAYAYNALVSSWEDIQSRADELRRPQSEEQMSLDDLQQSDG